MSSQDTQEKDTPPSSPSTMGAPESPQYDSPKIQTQPSALSRAWSYLNEDVRANGLAEIELLILTFCIGLQGK